MKTSNKLLVWICWHFYRRSYFRQSFVSILRFSTEQPLLTYAKRLLRRLAADESDVVELKNKDQSVGQRLRMQHGLRVAFKQRSHDRQGRSDAATDAARFVLSDTKQSAIG